ncbi:MAG: ATP-binding cassette domain-containing protein [Pirellulales bacterium]|nr:ATP-binding cassette domain-containing protein [Pirellulales bacterium]
MPTPTIRATSTASLDLSSGLAARPVYVRVRDLQHSFGEGETKKQVLFDNHLDVYRGEIVIMTGPSGSGKTTLLTLIGTLRTVQEGSLKVFGKELRGATRNEVVALRRQMGFIFQAHNLFASLTAFQNVHMATELFDGNRHETDQSIRDLLKRLGLGERIHYKPDSLSGGQKQRVAIARALIHRPKIVLADEPTAALDELSGREVVTLFQEMASEHGCTVVIVTHDNRILDVADRIVNMVDGRIKSDVLVHEASVICEFLKGFPLFADLTPRTMTEVADKMMVERVDPGDYVIRQGDPGEKFYLIRSGKVDVLVDQGNGPERVASLGEGAYFGETALITHEPRNASIVAVAPSIFYTLGKQDFQAVVDSSATFEEELRKAIFDRQ